MARKARNQPAPDDSPGLFDLTPPGAPAPSPPVGDRQTRDEPARKQAVPQEPPLYSVGQLTGIIQGELEGLGRIRVEGELSGWKRATSGHLYFDLKDEGARIACVVWRSSVSRAVKFEAEEGMQVIARGRLNVYPPRGSYSLIVERLEPQGLGALLIQLEKLKAELAQRGWFERSRPLPSMPRLVGVVTSRDGAALRDFLRTRSLRWPGYPLRLCHTAVQGPGAAQEIADAIGRLSRSGVDVLVVCRGGGSLEDLWSFNERVVAEAIWNSPVPVVSGVGHETDTTLSDLVADHRAHTPTDAAQTVLPERAVLEQALERWGNYLIEAMGDSLEDRVERLQRLRDRPVLRSADWILDERARALTDGRARLRSAILLMLRRSHGSLQTKLARLERQSPRALFTRLQLRLNENGHRLKRQGELRLERAQGRLTSLTRALEGVSPLAVLGRGYSITRKEGEAQALESVDEVALGDVLSTRLARGELLSKVVSIEPPEDRQGDSTA